MSKRELIDTGLTCVMSAAMKTASSRRVSMSAGRCPLTSATMRRTMQSRGRAIAVTTVPSTDRR